MEGVIIYWDSPKPWLPEGVIIYWDSPKPWLPEGVIIYWDSPKPWLSEGVIIYWDSPKPWLPEGVIIYWDSPKPWLPEGVIIYWDSPKPWLSEGVIIYWDSPKPWLSEGVIIYWDSPKPWLPAFKVPLQPIGSLLEHVIGGKGSWLRMERSSVQTSRPAGSEGGGDWWTNRPPAVGMLQRGRQKLLQGAVVLCTLFLLLWMASFIYGSFCYSFMPRAAYSTPVHYAYRSDCEPTSSPLCSYPTANVSLLRNGKNQVMSLGQTYRISLEMEMPDSPTNHRLGMFMVRMTCFSREGRRQASSDHSTMLHYRSDLLRTVGTLMFLPGFLTGVAKQTQRLEVELFSAYTEDPAQLEVLSREVQIYSAQLHIYARLTGLRYLLFQYPVMSAVVGVSSNMLFLSVLLFFGYMRLLLGETSRPVR
ncbi:hypothetical protein NHX12_012112 [Muraenolepis orangiensis]|uniref:Seipin n=1 Tax=Muraenolepis orangiensis TaxID=630683 RepID=A0A9Q0I7V5_9TELE|nr:hypothetical protein NHX12_012112 [Muraenolepis orangiensis]